MSSRTHVAIPSVLALLAVSAAARDGRLLFVEENIRQTARALEVPLDPFRTWIALHETTHAFEFEAHPWLRPRRVVVALNWAIRLPRDRGRRERDARAGAGCAGRSGAGSAMIACI
jgi:uncharacterized protein (DUF2342 family)